MLGIEGILAALLLEGWAYFVGRLALGRSGLVRSLPPLAHQTAGDYPEQFGMVATPLPYCTVKSSLHT